LTETAAITHVTADRTTPLFKLGRGCNLLAGEDFAAVEPIRVQNIAGREVSDREDISF
jgi:hypothetical protein